MTDTAGEWASHSARALRSQRFSPFPWVLLLLMGTGCLCPLLANSQEIACDLCHDRISLSSPTHGDLACQSCHSNVQDLEHGESALEELPEGQLCAQCHEPEVTAFEESAHQAILECKTCHGEAHSILPTSDLASPVSPLKQVQLCASCHDSPQVIDNYLGSVHGRALVVSGLVNAPSCSDCHSSHGIFPSSDHRAAVSPQHVPETCGNCHLYILEVWKADSAHGQAWQEGRAGPVCTTCHSSHQVLEPRSSGERLKFPESCGGCHTGRYLTYLDSFHGQVTDLGFLTAATCSDCHTPHNNLPADQARSTVHPDNLEETCGKCHPDITPGFVTFDPHNDPANPSDNRQVYLVWLFMTALLVSVFGGFGLHDLLWLQRSLVGYLRGEFKPGHSVEGPHVRRFSHLDIWVHVTMVVSFLLLAATGLPLKFHFADWAYDLASLLGGVGSTRLLHRLAAVVTFGYALFHLGYLCRRIVFNRDFQMLWGWRSMVPRPQDFIDLWNNVRYFLYLAPRPPMDRWSYWEKFDYLAVFWGVLIIGLSGLVLWFPAFFSQFFPGWILNAAFVIHSHEALLAVGFIFLFHFFHTHLRPEVFPLDPVIFTGRMPLARFKEEKPLEYQRLKESGELESYLVPPPSPQQRQLVTILGLSAQAVGIALILAVLWSYLVY